MFSHPFTVQIGMQLGVEFGVLVSLLLVLTAMAKDYYKTLGIKHGVSYYQDTTTSK